MMKKLKLLIQGIFTFKDWPLWIEDRFKVLKPRKVILFRLRNGVSFFLTQGEQGFGSFQEIFVEERYNKYYRIKKGDTVLDIGSGIGEYLVYASLREAKAVGYEADEKRFLFSKINLLVNKIGSNVFCKYISTLDDIQGADFLKMDIEGGEFEVVKNTSDMRRFKHIAIEFHDAPGPLVQKLASQGFEVKTEYTDEKAGYLYASCGAKL